MSEESNRGYDVFLSHSTHDKTWAFAACAVLERHQIRCWIAPRDILPGDEWAAAIIKGINQSRIMVLIFSGHANDSPQVRREVDLAIDQGLHVVPVRIEDVQPEGSMEFTLSSTHWLDAFTPPLERHLEEVARSVRALLDQAVKERVASDHAEAQPPPDGADERRSPTPEAAVSARPDRRLMRLGLVGAAVLGVLVFGVIFAVRGRDNRPPMANLVAPSSDGQAARSQGPPDSGVAVGVSPKTAEAPSKAAVKNRARKTAAKQPSPPATTPAEQPKRSALPDTRTVYVDEFNGKRTGLVRDLKTPPTPNPGVSDGVFYIYAPRRVWRAWNRHRFDSDSTCEVVGRVSSDDDPAKKSAWSVLILSTSGTARGMRVNINLKGELIVEPDPWPGAKEFLKVDPRIGPVAHPAIRPGGEYNKLLLLVRKREVTIFVNDVQICDPVKLEYDLTPSLLQVGTTGPGNRLAEFDRIEIREIIRPKDDKPKDRDAQASSTGGRS